MVLNLFRNTVEDEEQNIFEFSLNFSGRMVKTAIKFLCPMFISLCIA